MPGFAFPFIDTGCATFFTYNETMDKKMNTFPLITLGIPIYNAASLIERTLLSALNQTYPNIEFVFVDDKGDSMDIVRRVVGEHPRGSAVRIIDQVVNQGTGCLLYTSDAADE